MCEHTYTQTYTHTDTYTHSNSNSNSNSNSHTHTTQNFWIPRGLIIGMPGNGLSRGRGDFAVIWKLEILQNFAEILWYVAIFQSHFLRGLRTICGPNIKIFLSPKRAIF